jgi:hypothetical protein
MIMSRFIFVLQEREETCTRLCFAQTVGRVSRKKTKGAGRQSTATYAGVIAINATRGNENNASEAKAHRPGQAVARSLLGGARSARNIEYP